MLLHPCRPSDKHDPDNASAVLRLTATPSGHTERPHRAALPRQHSGGTRRRPLGNEHFWRESESASTFPRW